MVCYQCGNTLGAGRFCLSCGANITLYRRIVRLSNSCYNAGLEKARVRDLTGAVGYLEKSLQFYKNNTSARNLLGLVYYEMGEVVDAICQWVVSTNLQPKDNPAERYLEMVQSNRNELEQMNQAIKKFNQALEYATHGSEDLAIIQLRGVLSQHPKYIKAGQLLALLYIGEEEYGKASRILKSMLQIDSGNTFCQKYARSIRKKSTRPSKLTAIEQQAARALENDVIIPEQKERPGILRFALGLLLGIGISVCLWAGLILPSQRHRSSMETNQLIISYSEQLDDLNRRITELTEQTQKLQTGLDAANGTIDSYTGENGLLTAYDRLLALLEPYAAGEWDTLKADYETIDAEASADEGYKRLYRFLGDILETEVPSRIFAQALPYINKAYYSDAIPLLEKCLTFNENHEEALYYLGFICEKRGQSEQAKAYYSRLVTAHPESTYAPAARQYIGS